MGQNINIIDIIPKESVDNGKVKFKTSPYY